MYWNRSYVEQALSLGATSGTKTIDLPKNALISEILLRFLATNGTNPNKDNFIHEKVKKIEVIVNGSEVVKSITGIEALALAFYNSKKVPHSWTREDANLAQYEEFPICFGRFAGDLKYMLDTSKVINPQLKITWDTTGAGLDGTSLYSTTTYPVVDVSVLQLVDGFGIAPVGFFKSSEILTWSFSSNNEEKRVELPIGNKYRRIMLRAHSQDYWPFYILGTSYLDLNRGVRQPFKMDCEEWMAMNREIYGMPVTSRLVVTEYGDGHRKVRILNPSTAIMHGHTNDLVCVSAGGSGERYNWVPWNIRDTGYFSGAGGAHLHAEGDCYMSTLILPFDHPTDDFLFDSSEWSDVDFVPKAWSAGISTVAPACAVVLEELIVK